MDLIMFVQTEFIVQTLTEENYLKAIFKLSQMDLEKISPTLIAEEMKVNAASVIDMIKKLKEKKLINYDKKRGAALTTEGVKLALNIVRKHRLWEVFLCEKLSYNWDEVHETAEQLEHIQNNDLADRLDKFLGFPQFDPHGDPIPKANGSIPKLPKILLAEKKIGDDCQVVAIKDTSPEFLQYLRQLSIEIGTKIVIKDKIAFDNSLIIAIMDNQATVSEKFANSIFVKRSS
ncbi:MAG: metal-dependent transcriptional regulator [Sphingobacteriaceae bacterium]